MDFLKKFNSHSDYVSFTGTTELIKPNVSYCKTENEVHYNPYIDYSKDYLTFVALEDGTFTFSRNDLQYSLDNGATWATLTANTATPTVTSGNKIMWKQSGLTPSSAGIGTFIATGNFNVQGNIMSLYYGDDFKNKTDLSGKNYAFANLFIGNTKVVSAENLSLLATTLAKNCYYQMFYGCTSLTKTPKLLSTTLADSCYMGMFQGCSSLTKAPTLPAITLASGCYDRMFRGCTSLTTAPELLATTLASSCYKEMLYGCTSLKTAPELPATTLAYGCYSGMFYNCTSLTTAPSILPATTLANGCYSFMFKGCIRLTTAPSILPATTLENECYFQMFEGCISLTKAPTLPAITLASSCYRSMFYGCSSLNSITCLATDISASNCTTSWVNGVASNGTFTKAASMTSWTSGNNGIPTSWTVVDAA